MATTMTSLRTSCSPTVSPKAAAASRTHELSIVCGPVPDAKPQPRPSVTVPASAAQLEMSKTMNADFRDRKNN
jgi:hypothetical protein